MLLIILGGIVDFASGTFDSVKRVTETSQEIGKKRPARFLKSDGITRYVPICYLYYTLGFFINFTLINIFFVNIFTFFSLI